MSNPFDYPPLFFEGRYWLTPTGQMLSTKGLTHAEYAAEHILHWSVEEVDDVADDICGRMQQDGYVQVTHDKADKALYFQNKPSNRQLRALKDFAIERRIRLVDDTHGAARTVWSPQDDESIRISSCVTRLLEHRLRRPIVVERHGSKRLAKGQLDRSKLKQQLSTPEAYAILGDAVDTWLSGGCLLLAKALQSIVGGELVGVWDRGIQHHVVLKLGDRYLDGDGESTEQELLARWHETEGLEQPYIRPYKPESSWYAPPQKVKQLAAFLSQRLAT